MLEASRLGLARCILPETARKDVDGIKDLDLVFVANLRAAFQAGLGSAKRQKAASPEREYSAAELG